jgi:hypothetical protein
MYIDQKNPALIIMNEEAGDLYDVIVIDMEHMYYELVKLLNYQWATKEVLLALKALYLEVLYEKRA